MFLEALRNPRLWALYLTFQLPSLRVLFKYVPDRLWLLIPVFWVVSWLACALILHHRSIMNRLSRASQRVWLPVVLFFIILLVKVLLYPGADSLKMLGAGSDQDDALIQAAHRLIAGLNPYAEPIYKGNFISPGPGWILLTLPFSLSGLYVLLTPVATGAAALAVGRSRSASFLLLLMICPAFWELMVVGSDFLALGCAFLFMLIAVREWGAKPKVWLLAAVFVGMAATARIVFAYLPIVLAAFLYRRDRRAGVRMGLVSTAVCFGLHGIFHALDSGYYAPLHLFIRAGDLMPPAAVAGGGIVVLAFFLFSVLRLQESPVSWLKYGWLILIVPLLIMSLADLNSAGGDFSYWEGASYFGPALPVCAAWVLGARFNAQDAKA